VLKVDVRGQRTSELRYAALEARGCFERLQRKMGDRCLHAAREREKPFFMRYRVAREERGDEERNEDSDEFEDGSGSMTKTVTSLMKTAKKMTKKKANTRVVGMTVMRMKMKMSMVQRRT
jgi:hypothetical protein